jgi:hypothetical protein
MDHVDMAGSLGGVCSSGGNPNRLVDQPGESQRQRTELANLRRVRIYTQRQLAKWEPILADLRAKLEATEAAIQAIAPELKLTARFHRPNPIFPKGEMTRMTLDVLREAGEPLRSREIVLRLLAAKGITMPEPRLRKRTQHSLSAALSVLKSRGMVVLVMRRDRWVWGLV